MKINLIFVGGLILAIGAGPAFARDTYTQGYYRQNGTYVQPHYSSPPDGNAFNNYSTQGNVNPYTGQAGTVNPYAPPPAPKLYNPYATTP